MGSFPFEVRAVNGKVNLYGQVTTHFEQQQAADVASGVNGVAEVGNWVGVPSPTMFDGTHLLYWNPAAPHPALHPIPDFALAARIRSRYLWSASLHDQDVGVQVGNGRVTLTGTVDTWPDRKQAVLDAYEAGAREVNNHLHVSTAPR